MSIRIFAIQIYLFVHLVDGSSAELLPDASDSKSFETTNDGLSNLK